MAKKKYVVHTAVISGFFMAISLFAYLLISHHMSMPNQVTQSRAGLLSNGQNTIERIKPVGKLFMELPAEVVVTNASISATTLPQLTYHIYVLTP